jgi:hypothetical protein
MDEEPTDNAGAFRCEKVRWSPSGAEQIRLAVNDDTDASGNDVGITAQVEPANLCLVADPSADLAHEWHCYERDRTLPDPLPVNLDLFYCCGNECRTGGFLELHNESVAGPLEHEVGPGGVFHAYFDVIQANSQQSGECLGYFCRLAVVLGSRTHA